jgi:hypothetical protein
VEHVIANRFPGTGGIGFGAVVHSAPGLLREFGNSKIKVLATHFRKPMIVMKETRKGP